MRLGGVDITEETKMVVIGGGESGVGAALLAKKLGVDVYVSDSNKIKAPYKEELIKNNIRFEEGGYKEEWLFNVHVAIKSPGVPDHAPLVNSLTEFGIPFFSEIEFGYHFYTGLLLAVTGSNGKTTTSGLLSHVLTSAGYDVALCGNVGTSMCRILADRQPDYLVVEVSSFQLDNVQDFRPNVSILLNITEDHLDRYDYNFDLYADAKIKIASQQEKGDTFIYNADATPIIQRLNHINPSVQLIPIHSADYEHAVKDTEGKVIDLSLLGKHNRCNAACVVAAASAIAISNAIIHAALATYVNYPHRLERVANYREVTYINDSKATNVDAVYFALDGIDGQIVWIVGGVDKGNDYTVLDSLIQEKVKAVISLGMDNAPLEKWMETNHQSVVLHRTQSMEEAVVLARDCAVAGDTVLLSPACASFDLFDNYMHRGDRFRDAVLQLVDLDRSGVAVDTFNTTN